MKWTAEDWKTASGKKACKKGSSGKYTVCDRYLPAKAWDKLSPQAKAATQKTKRRAKRQYVRNAPKAKAAGQKARKSFSKKFGLGAPPRGLKYIPFVIAGGLGIFIYSLYLQAKYSRESEIVVDKELAPGLGEISVTGYKKNVPFTIKVKELSDYPGHYLQSSPVNVWSAFENMGRQAQADGITFKVNSSFRDMAKQTQLYAAYKNGTGSLAAKPGYSTHQMGSTVDISVRDLKVYNWLVENGPGFGFKQTVPSEKWHWEYIG
jgi:hypothetical protein